MSKEYPDGISERDIELMLMEVKTAWLKSPHLRLGQLIEVATMKSGYMGSPFYVEDSELIEGLRQL